MVLVVQHRIVLGSQEVLRVLLMVFVGCIRTIVCGTGKVTVLHASILAGYGVEVAHLHYVYLAAAWPAVAVYVVAHHPVGWPQAVLGLWHFYACLNESVLEGCTHL